MYPSNVLSLFLLDYIQILFHYLFVLFLAYNHNILYIFLQSLLYSSALLLHTTINIFLDLLHLYMYIDNIFYLLANLLLYIHLAHILHLFAILFLFPLVFHIVYYAFSLMYFLLPFLCKILYLVVSLPYTMMLFSLYILFCALIYTITHLTLFSDFFLHNFLSILFLDWYVILGVLFLVYNFYLIDFPLYHHIFLPTSIMSILIYDTSCKYILYLHYLNMFLLHFL